MDRLNGQGEQKCSIVVFLFLLCSAFLSSEHLQASCNFLCVETLNQEKPLKDWGAERSPKDTSAWLQAF